MIKKHLGDTIDLHTGGVDLLFPHHENEIAQSECCNGTLFSRCWYHSEHLLVDGRKMSKSLGNLYTLDDLTAKGFSAMGLRYALLAAHPRKQLNFSLDSLHAAESALKTLRQYRTALAAKAAAPAGPAGTFFDGVLTALRDDLNTPMAMGVLFSALHDHPAEGLAPAEAAGALAGLDRALWLLGLNLAAGAPESPVPPAVAELAARRWQSKRAKDFAASDALRREIAAAGWSMLDGKDDYRLEKTKP
jgi:cysteinyl-tRNA synthetase